MMMFQFAIKIFTIVGVIGPHLKLNVLVISDHGEVNAHVILHPLAQLQTGSVPLTINLGDADIRLPGWHGLEHAGALLLNTGYRITSTGNSIVVYLVPITRLRLQSVTSTWETTTLGSRTVTFS